MKLKIPDFFKDSIKLSTIVIAIATVANVIVAFFMWETAQDSVKLTQEALKLTRESIKLTEDIFRASHRPFVGAEARADIVDQCLIVSITYRNYGDVPAKDLEASWEITINGVIQPQFKITDAPTVLFPKSSNKFAGQTCDKNFISITEGVSTLEVTFKVEYQGISNEKQHTFQKFRYSHIINEFMDMGGSWD